VVHFKVQSRHSLGKTGKPRKDSCRMVTRQGLDLGFSHIQVQSVTTTPVCSVSARQTAAFLSFSVAGTINWTMRLP
jgi:hypothetical protein